MSVGICAQSKIVVREVKGSDRTQLVTPEVMAQWREPVSPLTPILGREEWHPIPVSGYEGLYEVSNHGRIRQGPENLWPGRIFKHGKPNADGYIEKNLTDWDGEKRLWRMHRLVCAAFNGPPPSDKHHACHRNGHGCDNDVGNLYWGTDRENHQDRELHGHTARGARNGRAKLAPEDIPVIRRLLENGMSNHAIARVFAVDARGIGLIRGGKNWGHIEGIATVEAAEAAVAARTSVAK